MKKTIAAIFTLILTATLAIAQDAQKQDKPKPPAESQRQEVRPVTVYKVDLAIYEVEAGKRKNVRRYTMHIDDAGNNAHVKFGSRIPVATGSTATGNTQSLVNTQFQYIDVGTNIRLRIEDRNMNMLAVDVDLSDFTFPEQGSQIVGSQLVANQQVMRNQPIIRQARASNFIPVTALTKPTVVGAIEDPNSTKRYEIEATATKIQ